ncbi:MAG: hypothetical protein IJ583_07035 [Firmicutes bacterium]|nr:hypothetical protein [Bacillota bacterium]
MDCSNTGRNRNRLFSAADIKAKNFLPMPNGKLRLWTVAIQEEIGIICFQRRTYRLKYATDG